MEARAAAQGSGRPASEGLPAPDASGAEAEKPCPGVTVPLPLYELVPSVSLLSLWIHFLCLSTYSVYPCIISPCIYSLISPAACAICPPIHPAIYLLIYPLILSTHPLTQPSMYLFHLSTHPSISLFYLSIYLFCLSIHPSVYRLIMSVHSFIHLATYSIYPSIHRLSIPPFIVYLSIRSPIYPCIPFTYLLTLSIHSSICLLTLFIHLFAYPIFLSIHPSVDLSITSSIHPFICLWLWLTTWEDVCPQGTLGKSLGAFWL